MKLRELVMEIDLESAAYIIRKKTTVGTDKIRM